MHDISVAQQKLRKF